MVPLVEKKGLLNHKTFLIWFKTLYYFIKLPNVSVYTLHTAWRDRAKIPVVFFILVSCVWGIHVTNLCCTYSNNKQNSTQLYAIDVCFHRMNFATLYVSAKMCANTMCYNSLEVVFYLFENFKLLMGFLIANPSIYNILWMPHNISSSSNSNNNNNKSKHSPNWIVF